MNAAVPPNSPIDEVLICDEPVSALDVSVQAQILNLLADIKDRFDLTMLFIAHDLAVVRNVSDHIAVMYLGRLCEVGSSDVLCARPAHPYTRALLASVPPGEPGQSWHPPPALDREPPSPVDPPTGCRFHTRCPWASERCVHEQPRLRPVGARGHHVACHHADPADTGVSASAAVGPPVRSTLT